MYDNEDNVCGVIYNDSPFSFLKNLQGDVITIIDKTGKTVAGYNYDAWGVCTIQSDTSGCDIAMINPYRYRGYYYDTEIGMYYLQSRYYDPSVGRFVNADEYENLGYASRLLAYNMFTYCDNDLVNYTDKEGRAIWSTIAKLALGALSQYAGDIIQNIINGKKGWNVFKPTSTIGEYISAAISSLFKGGKILKNIAVSFITTVIKAIERAIKGKKQSMRTLLTDFFKNAVLGIIGDFVTTAITTKIMSLTPKNYSKFAHSQYLKNANIKPSQIRTKMQKLIKTGIRTSNAFGFLVNSIMAAA